MPGFSTLCGDARVNLHHDFGEHIQDHQYIKPYECTKKPKELFLAAEEKAVPNEQTDHARPICIFHTRGFFNKWTTMGTTYRWALATKVYNYFRVIQDAARSPHFLTLCVATASDLILIEP